MTVDWQLVGKVVGGVLTLLLGALLDRWLERRPKLVAYYGHISAFTLGGPAAPTTMNMHSVVIANGGKKPAINVRLGHYYLPTFQLTPSVQCSTVPLPSGGDELVLPTLVPGEQVTISYVYYPPITWNMINSYVKSDEGMATVITVLPTRQYPRWLLNVMRLVLFVGVVAILYGAFALVRALLH